MKKSTAVECTYRNVLYSPRGDVEGLLCERDGDPVQFVFERDDHDAVASFNGIRSGQALVVEATRQGLSSKGESEHGVFAFRKLVSIAGRKQPARRTVRDRVHAGTVARFNFARHGEANGVVLDTGDFIHTKPAGLARLKLRVGSAVRASGIARPLSVGTGQVVEAVKVNGKRVIRG